jgi:hypothetical protein
MNQQFTGDFSLKEVRLYPLLDESKLAGNNKYLDIKQLVQEITLNESVISTSLYCQLVIQDIGNNIIGSLPLVGQERIELVISTSYANYNLNFYIYKIDGRAMREKNQLYVMHCVSKEALINEYTRIRERVDAKKAEDFIEDKLKIITGENTNSNSTENRKFKKLVKKDATLYPFNMYVPNWRLFDTAIWMSRRSVSTDHKDSVGYLFYETFEGYYYRSVDAIFKSDPYPNKNTKYTFIQGNTNASKSELNNYRIFDYSSPKAFDILEDLRNGAFCHNALYIDINNRNYRNLRTNASTYWDNMEHLEKLTPFQDPQKELLEQPSRLIYRPTTISTFNWKDLSNSEIQNLNNIDDVNKSFEKSIYRYYFLEYNKLEISIPGDLKLRAGSVISVSIPSPQKSSTGKVQEDARMSGRYMVHSIRHTIINRTELRTFVTLSRDSFGGNEISKATVTSGDTF